MTTLRLIPLIVYAVSIFLALKTNNSNEASAVFLAKKLNGYAPAPVGSLGVFGVARYPEAAYGLYRSFIDAFCYATVKKAKMFANAEAFSDIYLAKLSIPFPTPDVAFSPATTLTHDQATQFLGKLGDRASMKNIGRTLEYTVSNPSIGDIPKYLKAANPHYAVGSERLTPLGLKAYSKIIGLLELFLATNTYPAFKDLDSEIPQGPGMEMKSSGHNGDDGKTYFYGYTDGLKRGSATFKDGNSVLKRRKVVKAGSTTGGTDMEVDEKREEVPEHETQNAVFTMSDPWINTSVVMAKPSGKLASYNFGPPGSVPNLPGLVFPYFKGLNRADYNIFMEICINHFFRLFGTNIQGCKEELASLKNGFQSLAGTDSGIALAHAFKGVELALKTQTRLFLIFDTEYKGFALLGGHFGIYDGSKWIGPVSAMEVKEELSKMDTHGAAITEIARMLSELEITADKSKYPVSSSALDSSLALIGEMKIRDFTGLVEKEEFDQALRSLIWQRPFVQLTPDSFLSFMAAFFDTSDPPAIDRPIYIPSFKAPVGNRLFQHLGVFGPDAPSLWNSRGSIISVIAAESRKGKEKQEAPAIPKEIIILPKPILVAVQDWQKIIKTGTVSFNFKERAKEYRAHVVRGDLIRKSIWEKLQEGLTKLQSKEDGEPEKKKAKADETPVVSADAILGLW